MSLASATGQVIFSQKGGVYMPAIQCNQGDLYQEYMGEASAPTNIAPDSLRSSPSCPSFSPLRGWRKGWWSLPP